MGYLLMLRSGGTDSHTLCWLFLFRFYHPSTNHHAKAHSNGKRIKINAAVVSVERDSSGQRPIVKHPFLEEQRLDRSLESVGFSNRTILV